LLFVPAALLWGWGFWLGAAVLLAVNVLFWRGVRWQGLYGETNPAVVVSTEPSLVAVWTDMTTGGDPWPAIKVVPQPLGRMTGGPPAVGDRLAAVALYYGSGKEGHWDDFTPEVVNCLTTDPGVIARVVATIDEEQWQALTEGLGRIPTPAKPGLCPLAEEEEEEGEDDTREPFPRRQVEDLVKEHLPNRFVDSWHLAGNIPEKKLKNALDTYAREVEPAEVLGLYDSSAFGSGKEGMVLTALGFVFRNQKKGADVRWRNVAGAEVVGGWPSYYTEVEKVRGRSLRLDCAGFDGKFPPAFAELLQHIGELNES
jgi:hypothetical protein